MIIKKRTNKCVQEGRVRIITHYWCFDEFMTWDSYMPTDSCVCYTFDWLFLMSWRHETHTCLQTIASVTHFQLGYELKIRDSYDDRTVGLLWYAQSRERCNINYFFSFHGLCCRLSVQDLFTKGLLSEHHLVNNLKYNIMFTDMYIPL